MILKRSLFYGQSVITYYYTTWYVDLVSFFSECDFRHFQFICFSQLPFVFFQRSSEYQSSGYHSFWLLVPLGLAELSPFRPPDTVGTGGTRPFCLPGTLGTGGTQSFQPPRYPGDWRGSVLSGPQVPLGLAGLSLFWPPGTCLLYTSPSPRD